MLARLERKLAEVQRWVDSVQGVADLPAAIALAAFRTRPSQRVHEIWIRPAALKGFAVCVDPTEMSDFVVYEEVFMDGVYDLDRVRFTPDAIVDCGAYHGYFTLLAAARYPGVPIVAFEPNDRNLSVLNVNLRHNDVAADVRPSAVSTRDGEASFSGGGCGGHLATDAHNAVTVPMTDLTRVIREMRCERLLLKLDIEGEEASLIPALLPVLPKTCAMFFEWHHGADAFNRIESQLTSKQFTTTVTRQHQLDDGITYIDALAQR